MVTVRHEDFLLKDGDGDLRFDAGNPADRIFDAKNGVELTVSQAKVIDPEFQDSYEFQNRNQNPDLQIKQGFLGTPPIISTRQTPRIQNLKRPGLSGGLVGAAALLGIGMWTWWKKDQEVPEVSPDYIIVASSGADEGLPPVEDGDGVEEAEEVEDGDEAELSDGEREYRMAQSVQIGSDFDKKMKANILIAAAKKLVAEENYELAQEALLEAIKIFLDLKQKRVFAALINEDLFQARKELGRVFELSFFSHRAIAAYVDMNEFQEAARVALEISQELQETNPLMAIEFSRMSAEMSMRALDLEGAVEGFLRAAELRAAHGDYDMAQREVLEIANRSLLERMEDGDRKVELQDKFNSDLSTYSTLKQVSASRKLKMSPPDFSGAETNEEKAKVLERHAERLLMLGRPLLGAEAFLQAAEYHSGLSPKKFDSYYTRAGDIYAHFKRHRRAAEIYLKGLQEIERYEAQYVDRAIDQLMRIGDRRGVQDALELGRARAEKDKAYADAAKYASTLEQHHRAALYWRLSAKDDSFQNDPESQAFCLESAAEEMIEHGKELVDKDQIADARAAFKMASDLYVEAAEIYEGADEGGDAKDSYRKAIRVSEEFFPQWEGLADAREKLEALEE